MFLIFDLFFVLFVFFVFFFAMWITIFAKKFIAQLVLTAYHGKPILYRIKKFGIKNCTLKQNWIRSLNEDWCDLIVCWFQWGFRKAFGISKEFKFKKKISSKWHSLPLSLSFSIRLQKIAWWREKCSIFYLKRKSLQNGNQCACLTSGFSAVPIVNNATHTSMQSQSIEIFCEKLYFLHWQFNSRFE